MAVQASVELGTKQVAAGQSLAIRTQPKTGERLSSWSFSENIHLLGGVWGCEQKFSSASRKFKDEVRSREPGEEQHSSICLFRNKIPSDCPGDISPKTFRKSKVNSCGFEQILG